MTRKYGNTEEEYREAVRSSSSIADMCRYLGLQVKGGNYRTINRKICEYDLDVSHFLGQAHNLGKILSINPVSRTTIKNRLIAERGHECERCHRTEWFDIPITLEVDHINGDTDENDFSNLKLLCPNCHSQTPTWRRAKSSFTKNPATTCPECDGKKKHKSLRCNDCYQASKGKNKSGQNNSFTQLPKKPRLPKQDKHCSCGTLISDNASQCTKCSHKKQMKIDWPDTNALIADIEASSYSAMGRKLGVSDNAIRKYLKNNGIDPKTFNPVLY